MHVINMNYNNNNNVPADKRVHEKESEKISKYADLRIEVEPLHSGMASLHSVFFIAKISQQCRSISFRQSDASPDLGLVSGPGDY